MLTLIINNKNACVYDSYIAEIEYVEVFIISKYVYIVETKTFNS